MTARVYDTKTTLKAELKVIPTVGWAVAGAWLLIWFALIIPHLMRVARPKPGAPPLLLLVAVLTLAGLVLAAWVLMVFYVSADARRRQMNRLLWTLLVIFIPNAIGFILYFILRHPIAQPCPKCRTLLRPEFAFCPACGEELTPKCPGCHHAIEAGWLNCAFCGARLS